MSSNRLVLTVARKEFVEIRRDRRFQITSITLLACIGLSLYGTVRDHAFWSEQAAKEGAAERERWLNQGATSPHSAAHHGVHAFLPRTQFSMLDPGITPYAGAFVFLEPHEQKLFERRPAEDSPPIRSFGEFTPAFLLQVIAPLLIILMLHGSFAAEREQGTLRQLLSLGVPARAIAAGKVLGAIAPLFAVLTPVALAGSAAILIAGGQEAGNIAPRLALLTGAVLCYFAAVSGMVLAISARARTVRGALALSVAFWAVTCLAAPRAALEVASRVHPAPTSLEHANALREEWFQRPVWYDLLAEVEKRLLKQYGVKGVADLPVSAAGAGLIEEEAGQKDAADRHFGRLYRAYAQQERFFQAASCVSPMIALSAISSGLSGSDFSHFRAFAAAAEEYRTAMVRSLNAATMTNQSAAAKPYEPVYRPGRELWGRIPAFSFTPPRLPNVLRGLSLTFAVLAVWMTAAITLAGVALRRLRPE
jgi:ABC-2 type transport system permease protein